MNKTLLCSLMFFVTLYVQGKEYNIIDFGAKNDTAQLSTEAIQNAIEECNKAGGGRVVVPAGTYKTGTLILKSDIELYLCHGATLYGSTDLNDYKKIKPDYLSLRTQTETIQLIYANKVKNVKICGSGTIDGQGKNFKKLSWNDEGITRPHLLRFIDSKDITIEDVTLCNSGCWMQHYLACDRLKIRGLKIYNRNNYNNDAFDIDGCHDVIISDILADSDDDGITLKSTSPRLCENINISNCIISSHCNAIKLGTETNGGFHNINIHGMVVKTSSDQSCLYFGNRHGLSAIALEIVDGGKMENINVSDVTVSGTESPIFIRLGNRARGYYEGQKIDNVGIIKDISLNNIRIVDAGIYGCSITGLPNHCAENITLNDIFISHKGNSKKTEIPTDEKEKDYPEATMWGVLPAKGFFIRHVRNIKMHNVEIWTELSDERPDFIKIDVE